MTGDTGKSQVQLITVRVAAFHLGPRSRVLVLCTLAWLIGTLQWTELSLMLLITPVITLYSISAVKKV